jgi:hypothetical protein
MPPAVEIWAPIFIHYSLDKSVVLAPFSTVLPSLGRLDRNGRFTRAIIRERLLGGIRPREYNPTVCEPFK